MQELRIVMIILLSGCYAELGGDVDSSGVSDESAGTPDESGEEPLQAARICPDVPAVSPQDGTPIFVYYGAYLRADNGELNWPANLELAGDTPGAQYVLVSNPSDPCARFRPWVEAGGQLAFKIPRAIAVAGDRSLEALIDRGEAADFIEAKLAEGYAYVSVDEISFAHGESAWFDGAHYSQAFADLLDELAARGLDRRLILYVNSYNNAGRLSVFGDVLRACHDHCRILGSEIYMHVANVLSSASGQVRAQSDPQCTFNLSCFDRLAAEMDGISPGINERTITILRLDDEGYSDGRVDSLCKSSTQLDVRGGLDHQYARLHAGTFTSQQPGAGGYTPTRVGRHPGWGAIHQAQCLGRLNAWWPEQPGMPLGGTR